MGAWGAGNFENDTAADWAGDLAEDGSVDDVREALEAAVRGEAEEDADVACEALVAAEVVAAAAGRPLDPDPYSEDVLAWAAQHPEAGTDELRALARDAVAAAASPSSELHELWSEDGPTDPEWTAALDDVRRRLA